jgi:hypothetical protein
VRKEVNGKPDDRHSARQNVADITRQRREAKIENKEPAVDVNGTQMCFIGLVLSVRER